MTMQYCMEIMRSWQKPDAKPQKIGILLFERFSNHCLANAVEPLSAANMLLGRKAYEWCFMSHDGASVHSSSGLPVAAQMALSQSAGGDALFLIPSYEHQEFVTPPVLRSLRSAAGRYGVLAGFDMGGWLLAAAGLLEGYQATVHWDEADNFQEAFPDVDVTRARVVMDRDRWTCGGAMTAFEMVLRMIGDTHGEALRIEVAAMFMQGESAVRHAGARPLTGQVTAAMAMMRENIEEPLRMGEIAHGMEMSQRKLERLFLAELGAGPQKVYRRMRLQAARRLVEQTGLTIVEIAIRCGYRDPSAMTRAFGEEFGVSPREVRAIGPKSLTGQSKKTHLRV